MHADVTAAVDPVVLLSLFFSADLSQGRLHLSHFFSNWINVLSTILVCLHNADEFGSIPGEVTTTLSLAVSAAWPGNMLHIKVRLPVLLCAVKTVEGDFRFCWTITPNVGQTHKENPNLVRILYMVCTLNDIYKQYNKLHEHWYTKISSLRCVADRNPPQNASDLYTKYWSYAEHCRPCTRLCGVNWWNFFYYNNTNCSYRIFIVCRSPVSPVFWARIRLSYLFLPKQSLCSLISR